MRGKTNKGQETHTSVEGCTNGIMAGAIKQDANGQNGQNQSNKSLNYFYSSESIEADKRKSDAMTQKSTVHLVIF